MAATAAAAVCDSGARQQNTFAWPIQTSRETRDVYSKIYIGTFWLKCPRKQI